MTSTMVLSSALLHALWNALLRREDDKDSGGVIAVSVAMALASVAAVAQALGGTHPFPSWAGVGYLHRVARRGAVSHRGGRHRVDLRRAGGERCRWRRAGAGDFLVCRVRRIHRRLSPLLQGRAPLGGQPNDGGGAVHPHFARRRRTLRLILLVSGCLPRVDGVLREVLGAQRPLGGGHRV